MIRADDFQAFARRVNPGLGRFLTVTERDFRFVKGEGIELETDAGERYEDWIGSFGALPLGHRPSGVARAIATYLAGEAPSVYSQHQNPFAGALADELVEAAGPGFETAYLCNSGGESVEAALKLAVRLRQGRVAYARGGYHGSTCGAVACTSGHYQRGFEPLLAEQLAFDPADLASLEEAFRREPLAAVLLEPIQVERGVRVVADDVLARLRELCDRYGALLILDEAQTGLGRTGELFRFQATSVRPDVVCLGEALGAGLVPAGAAIVASDLWSQAYGSMRTCELHETLLGGNALTCVAARAVLEQVREPEFLARVRSAGATLFGSIEEAARASALVREVRWVGLLGGVQLDDPDHPWLSWEAFDLGELSGEPLAGALLIERLGRAQILAQVCRQDWSVLRVTPPLDVSDASCERYVRALAEGLGFLQERQ